MISGEFDSDETERLTRVSEMLAVGVSVSEPGNATVSVGKASVTDCVIVWEGCLRRTVRETPFRDFVRSTIDGRLGCDEGIGEICAAGARVVGPSVSMRFVMDVGADVEGISVAGARVVGPSVGMGVVMDVGPDVEGISVAGTRVVGPSVGMRCVMDVGPDVEEISVAGARVVGPSVGMRFVMDVGADVEGISVAGARVVGP